MFLVKTQILIKQIYAKKLTILTKLEVKLVSGPFLPKNLYKIIKIKSCSTAQGQNYFLI